MEEKWRENLIKIEPYVAGEQSKSPNLIKLNANENAYPPSPKTKEVLENLNIAKLRKYPDAMGEPLKSTLAEYYGLKKGQIFVGNGSDDVLAAAFRAFFNSDKPIFYPDITYSFYPVWCDLMKVPYELKKLNDDFTINTEDYYAENGGVIFPNPNAPTSIGMGLDKVRDILDHNQDVIVVIDETYVDFGGETALPLLDEYKNLVITRTFSKSRSLAGIRLGFAMASEELVSYMNAVKDSYNTYPLDTVAMAVGTASVKDEKYFRDTLDKIIKTREKVSKELEELGFEVFPSQTNFLFTKHKTAKSVDIFEYLKTKEIFIRHFSAPRVNEYLRITVGTNEEMKKMMTEIKKFLER